MSNLQVIAISGWLLLGRTQTTDDVYKSWSLPDWVQQTVRGPTFAGNYELYFGVNPYFQRGDFDGDGSADVAVLVRERATKKIGVAFVRHASRSWNVVGAGAPLGNGGDDWSWLAVWRMNRAYRSARISSRGPVCGEARVRQRVGLLGWDALPMGTAWRLIVGACAS
jgi:hypothetical protein